MQIWGPTVEKAHGLKEEGDASEVGEEEGRRRIQGQSRGLSDTLRRPESGRLR